MGHQPTLCWEISQEPKIHHPQELVYDTFHSVNELLAQDHFSYNLPRKNRSHPLCYLLKGKTNYHTLELHNIPFVLHQHHHQPLVQYHALDQSSASSSPGQQIRLTQ